MNNIELVAKVDHLSKVVQEKKNSTHFQSTCPSVEATAELKEFQAKQRGAV